MEINGSSVVQPQVGTARREKDPFERPVMQGRVWGGGGGGVTDKGRGDLKIES